MKEKYGIVDGQIVYLYTLKDGDLEVKVSDYGATLISVKYLNQETILSYDCLDDYFNNGAFYGCLVLPIANRTANATFTIDNIDYHLDKNDNGNNLHTSFYHSANKRIWKIIEENKRLICTIDFLDGEKGIPGDRQVKVIYAIKDNSLFIDFYTISNKKSVFAPTNHAYFNLDGSENILEHELKLNCSRITELKEGLIPTGKFIDVTNTPFDFRKGKLIGQDIYQDNKQILLAKGYDHNFCLDNYDGSLKEIACLTSFKTNIKVSCLTTLPGVQIYTGNYLPIENHGVCMEAQFYPNALNIKEFPSPIINENKEYHYTIAYKYEKR